MNSEDFEQDRVMGFDNIDDFSVNINNSANATTTINTDTATSGAKRESDGVPTLTSSTPC